MRASVASAWCGPPEQRSWTWRSPEELAIGPIGPRRRYLNTAGHGLSSALGRDHDTLPAWRGGFACLAVAPAARRARAGRPAGTRTGPCHAFRPRGAARRVGAAGDRPAPGRHHRQGGDGPIAAVAGRPAPQRVAAGAARAAGRGGPRRRDGPAPAGPAGPPRHGPGALRRPPDDRGSRVRAGGRGRPPPHRRHPAALCDRVPRQLGPAAIATGGHAASVQRDGCDGADLRHRLRGVVVLLSTRDVGEQLEIQVSDRGHGLGARHPETLFQPYYTTKSNGLGLGLSVARNIGRSHGGTIHARRRPGGGAVFTLALPRQATAAAALPRARSPVRLSSPRHCETPAAGAGLPSWPPRPRRRHSRPRKATGPGCASCSRAAARAAPRTSAC